MVCWKQRYPPSYELPILSCKDRPFAEPMRFTMADAASAPKLLDVSLDDKYTAESGHAFMTGTQALVRLPMEQHRRDKAAGLNTAGFITGYRGSPLGGYDQQLAKAGKLLKEN